MSQTTLQIQDPSTIRIATIGGAAGTSALLWIAALVVVVRVPGHFPETIWQLILALAATSTMVAVVLGITYGVQKSACHNHRVIATAIGQLAAQQEQLSAKLDTFDRWEIYSQAAHDILGDRDRKQ